MIQVGNSRSGTVAGIHPALANRHGLIAGAAGTGRTVTLQVLAEQFSEAGVPVFATDVKGDLSGIAHPGEITDAIMKRAVELGITGHAPSGYPVRMWDLFGEKGQPLRASVHDMGPMVMARLLDLSPAQSGVLDVVYMFADRLNVQMQSLLSLNDLVRIAHDNTEEVSSKVGYVSKSALAFIQRGVAGLEHRGEGAFFGVPPLDVNDLMQTHEGRGVVNILAADALMESPNVYAGFVAGFMQTLVRTLPEVGDPEKPTIVFFFDEAHLLFRDAPKPLLRAMERAVGLIRSKGAGIYFATRSPTDIPDEVLGQLGNRVQHALPAYTPKELRAVNAVAENYRENPAFDTQDVIGNLGKGEALVSTLEGDDAIPGVVQIVKVRPPRSFIGAPDDMSEGCVLPPTEEPEPLVIEEPKPKGFGTWIKARPALIWFVGFMSAGIITGMFTGLSYWVIVVSGLTAGFTLPFVQRMGLHKRE